MKKGEIINENAYVKRDSFENDGLIDMGKLFDLYNNNCTIVCQALQKAILKLKKTCLNLHSDTNIYFSANIYLTPSNSKGFDYHYDTHDVMILQTHGKKRFLLYDKPEYLPTTFQSYSNCDVFKKTNYDDKPPIFDKILEAGDLLYIPRGMVHKAESVNETSLHCTFGFFPMKWHDLFSTLNECITSYKPFRETIFSNVSERLSTSDIKEKFKTNLLKVLDSESFSFVIDEFLKHQKIDKRLPMNNSRLLNIESINNLNNETRLKVVTHTHYQVNEGNETISLSFHEKKIIFPKFMSQSIYYIVNKKEFAIKDIKGEIDIESKMVFVKKLIKEGFLVNLSLE